MAKKITKSTLLFTIVLMSAFIVPMIPVVTADTVLAEEAGIGMSGEMTNEQYAAAPEMIAGIMAGAFGAMDGLGPSGAALGQVFTLLFENIIGIETFESNVFDGVYMLNATYTDEQANWTQTDATNERYYLPSSYQPAIGAEGSYNYAYLDVERSGTIEVNYTSGASVVFILWDHDESLITAINEVVVAINNVVDMIEAMPEDPNDWTEAQAGQVSTAIAGEILSAVTYLIFHINDIINGDELIVTNIITYETWEMTSDDYAVTVEAKKRVPGGATESVGVPGSSAGNDILSIAQANDDDLVEYLMDPSGAVAETGSINKSWTTLSFNLVELWIRNFEIHINASAISDMIVAGLNGEEVEAEMTTAQIFQGLDIDLYLITHSLLAFTAFDDTALNSAEFDNNNVPDVAYAENPEDPEGPGIFNGTEVKYWFSMGNIGEAQFLEPSIVDHYDKNGDFVGKGIQWNIKFTDIEMIPIPLGLTPGDLSVEPPAETLTELSLGFTFCPVREFSVDLDNNNDGIADYDEVSTAETEIKMGAGIIKLDQTFGAWNVATDPNGVIENDGEAGEMDLTGLDFAVMFITTMLHFHVNIQVDEPDQEFANAVMEGTEGIMNESDYTEEGAIYVGDQIEDQQMPVAAVDIAGPQYEQYESGPSGTPTKYDASTTTIPLLFLDYNLAGNCQYFDSENPNSSFSAEGFLEVDFSVMIYAVSYGTFNGSGDQIWHDPTFSVFMTWDNPGFWAVILVVGSVTLVAVAAVMITKKKNRA